MDAALLDSHCHLTDRRLLGQIDDIVARARAAGLAGMITVGCGADDSAAAEALADRFADIWFAAAIHPHDAGSFSPELMTAVAARLGHRKAVAVGEIGLDYHYDFAPRDAQRAAFAAQLALAAGRNLPVIIHSRESVADALAVIAEVRGGSRPGPESAIRGVFHSFTGTPAEARAVLDAGFLISLSGVVTFKNAGELTAAARLIPADRLLLETDAPYLSPEPMRKIRTNEPALLPHTLACVAELRGVHPEQLAEQTARNTRALFCL